MFHFLNDQNKDYFVELLTLPFFIPITRTADDFFYLLKAMTNEMCMSFIPLFPRDAIRTLLKTDHMFHSFLKKITYQKEAFLLDYLGYTLTPT